MVKPAYPLWVQRGWRGVAAAPPFDPPGRLRTGEGRLSASCASATSACGSAPSFYLALTRAVRSIHAHATQRQKSGSHNMASGCRAASDPNADSNHGG